MAQHSSMPASTGIALHEPGAELHPSRHSWAVYASLLIVMFLSAMDQTVVGTAPPTIVDDLGSVAHMTWILTACILAITVAAPVYGKLGDLVGRRNLSLVAAALLLIDSALRGTADSMTQLIIYRFIQGPGSGGLMISSQAITGDLILPRVCGTYMASMGTMFSITSILRPIVDGWLTNSVSWRWTFWVDLPLGVLAFIVIFLVLHLPSNRLASPTDWWGLGLMNAGAIAIVLMAAWGGNQYARTNPVIIGLDVAGLAYWRLLDFVETRATDPILPWTILTNCTFVVSTLVGMLAMGGIIDVLGYLSTYLQMVYEYSVITSGLLLVSITAGVLISSILSSVLVSRTDHYKIYPVAGPLVAVGAASWLSCPSMMSPVWQISVATFLMGAGTELLFQLLVAVVQNALPAKHLGTAASGNNFFRKIGVSLGVSLIGAAFPPGLTSNLMDRIGALAHSADLTILEELARFKDADTSSLTPALVNQLPIALHDAVADSYADALLPIFGWMISLSVATSVVALFLPEVSLPQKTAVRWVAEAETEDEPSGPTSPQEPDSTPQQTERKSTEPVMATDTE